jgi:hypothetical protein
VGPVDRLTTASSSVRAMVQLSFVGRAVESPGNIRAVLSRSVEIVAGMLDMFDSSSLTPRLRFAGRLRDKPAGMHRTN